MGRPRLGPLKKTHRVGVRVTEDDARRLQALAAHPLIRKAPGKPESLAGVAGMCLEDGLAYVEEQVAAQAAEAAP